MPDNLLPKVSIILLNYNGAKDTIDCLESLADISYNNYNVVIVDNASTDDSVMEVGSYLSSNGFDYTIISSPNEVSENKRLHAKLTVLQADHNGGYGYGNNIGINFALENGADYILVINNDTVVEPNFLEPMVQLCEEDKDIGIATGKIYFHDRPDIIWFNGGKYHPYTAKVVHVNFNEKDVGQKPPDIITFISGCLWLIPKDVFEKVGLINEEYFMYVEDLEYSQRILQHGYTLKICQKSYVWHKVGGSSDRGGQQKGSFSVYWISKNTYKFITSEKKNNFRLFAYIYLLFFKSFRFVIKGKYKLLRSHLLGIRDAIRS